MAAGKVCVFYMISGIRDRTPAKTRHRKANCNNACILLGCRIMRDKYPEPSLDKINTIQQKRTKKFLFAVPGIVICLFIWGSSVYGYGEFVPEVLVVAAMWMILPLGLLTMFSKCPKCVRYNCHVQCSVCKFQFPK